MAMEGGDGTREECGEGVLYKFPAEGERIVWSCEAQEWRRLRGVVTTCRVWRIKRRGVG